MYDYYDNVMENTLGDTAIDGGYLNLFLHGELIARIYVPPPFWEDKYRDSINENDDYFSDDAGNTYSIHILSAMGDISYSIEVDDIVDKKYYEDFEKNLHVEFEPIIPEEYIAIEDEYKDFEDNEKTKFYLAFIEDISITKNLNEIIINDEQQNKAYRKMIFINLITLIEVYFGDIFKLSLAKNPIFLALAIEKIKELSTAKIPLKELLDKKYTPLSYAEQIINSKILFHKLEKVNELYKAVFKEKIIDENSQEILQYIQIRHDLVHRNKTSLIEDFTKEYIDMVINNIEQYITLIDKRLYIRISDI